MKSMKNRLILLLVAVLITGLLAACSNGNKNADEDAGNAAGGNEGTADPITISFQHIGGTVPAQEEVLAELIDSFESDNPGIQVKKVDVTWDNAYSQFQNQVMVGQAPDVVMLQPAWAAEYLTLGALAPVNDYVSQEVLDIFLDSGFDAVRSGDQLFGTPWDGSIWGFFYRKDLFEQAGLDPNAPPKTWDELVEYGKTLTNGDQYGLGFAAGSWQPDDYFMPFLWQAGNPVLKKDGEGWVSTFNEESAKVGTQFYYDLFHKHQIVQPSATGMDWENAMNSFVAGDIAMMYNGSWIVNTLLANEDIAGKWATALSPEGPGGNTVLGYPNILAITEQSKHKEAAGKFLEHIYSAKAESGLTFYEAYSIATGATAWTHTFKDLDFAKDPIMQPFVAQVPNASNRPLVPGFEQFKLMHMNPGIQSMIMGDMTVDQFVDTMHDKWSETLSQ